MAANIFLIGFMGTGKTTISRQLSGRLKLGEIDLDKEIELREGRKISEIFESQGEAHFRELEAGIIREFETRGGFVVSCGGGAVLRQENAASMKKNGIVALLLAEPETVFERVRFGKNRPLLNGHMNVPYIRDLMAKREAAYQEAADFAVTTDGKKPQEISDEIVEILQNFKNPKISFDF